MGKLIDITGQRFGRLVALKVVGRNSGNNALWLCECDCGKTTVVTGTCLRRGVTQSCGCLCREKTIETNKARAKKTGGIPEPEYEDDDQIPFDDYWMFGEHEGQNKRWFHRLVV